MLPCCERSGQGNASELRQLGGRIAGGVGFSPSFGAAGACYRARWPQRLSPCPWRLLQEQLLQNIWMSLRAWVCLGSAEQVCGLSVPEVPEQKCPRTTPAVLPEASAAAELLRPFSSNF